MHKVKCKSQSQPPTVGVPFIVSLPKSQCTYRKLADVAEKFARSVCMYSFPIAHNNGTHTIKRRKYNTFVGFLIFYESVCTYIYPVRLLCCLVNSPHTVLVGMHAHY